MNQQTLISSPTNEVATTQPDFLTLAIERGVDADALEKLVALHERLEARKAEQAFNEALQQFQERVPVIPKNKRVNYATKQGGKVDYSYSTFDHVADTIRPLMTDLGLHYSFSTEPMDGKRLMVKCIVRHIDGHSIESTFPVDVDSTAKMNIQQQMASATTYAKRYALIQALGITTADTDDDAYLAGQSQRRELAGEPTKNDYNEIKRQWWDLFADKELKTSEAIAKFHQWVAKVGGISVTDAANHENWTSETLSLCVEAIELHQPGKNQSSGLLDA